MEEKISIRSAIGWTLFIFLILFEESWTFTHNFNEIENDILNTIITVIINLFFLFVIPFFLSDFISRILEKKTNYNKNKERVLRNFLLIICAFLFFFRAIINFFFQEKHLKEVDYDKFELVNGHDKGTIFLLITFGIICCVGIRRK
jgi:ABC-type Fe3+-siderophore transport system permease subunit